MARASEHSRQPSAGGAAGFTLVELVAVIVILAVVGTAAGVGFVDAARAYETARRQAQMMEVADRALRLIARDIRIAVPGSLRNTVPSAGSFYLELLASKNGGRYRAEDNGDILDVAAADTSFETLGAMSTLPSQAIVAGDYVVLNNQNAEPAAPGQNAYTHREAACTGGTSSANCNTAVVTSVSHTSDATTLGIGARDYPTAASGYAFYVMSGTPAVTYECIKGALDGSGNGSGTLKRYQGYPATLAKATPPTGGTVSIVARHVSDCSIVLRSDLGMAYLQITITRGNASSTFYHQVAVPNA